jgi:[ribosomal protein S18]-alanine N-acetyltransferase
MPLKVRNAIPTDIPQLIELERFSPTAAHWSEDQYRRAIEPPGDFPPRVALVTELDDLLRNEIKVPAVSPQQPGRQGPSAAESRCTPVGFLVAMDVSGEWQLENIVVGREFCRRGIGMQLIEALLARVRARKGRTVCLEVRESNVAARKLYQKAGFQETGRRKLYYSNPAEDGILYRRSVL